MIGVAAGCVVRTIGETLHAALPCARIGEGVRIEAAGGWSIAGRIVSVDRARVAIVPFGSLAGVGVGDRVYVDRDALSCVLGYALLGRAIDAAGAPIDGAGPIRGRRTRARELVPPPARRLPVDRPCWTGIRAIDALLTIGRGARVGIFGAPGAGKSTLLETIVAGASADAVVVALIGERGREAQRWIAATRGTRALTVVCATSDRSAAERSRAAEVAMAQAVTLRESGAHVLLVVDSLARYVAALREQRVALGEPVGRGGYPPSVFADLARYCESAGNGARGTVTMIATVLPDGGDDREPLGEAARSLLDGHIVLCSDLARAGRYPAIDVLASASRTMGDVCGREHAAAARHVRATLALLAQNADLRAAGLADPRDVPLAHAIAAEPAIHDFLQQREPCASGSTRRDLALLAAATS